MSSIASLASYSPDDNSVSADSVTPLADIALDSNQRQRRSTRNRATINYSERNIDENGEFVDSKEKTVSFASLKMSTAKSVNDDNDEFVLNDSDDDAPKKQKKKSSTKSLTKSRVARGKRKKDQETVNKEESNRDKKHSSISFYTRAKIESDPEILKEARYEGELMIQNNARNLKCLPRFYNPSEQTCIDYFASTK